MSDQADPWGIADALYDRGYNDRKNERDYDPRGSDEWQAAFDAINGLTAQRDELLAALKTLEKRASYLASQCGYFQDEVPEIVVARGAIAKTEAPHATEIRS